MPIAFGSKEKVVVTFPNCFSKGGEESPIELD